MNIVKNVISVRDVMNVDMSRINIVGWVREDWIDECLEMLIRLEIEYLEIV